MATLAPHTVGSRTRTTGRTRFYVWLSLACLAIGVGGFAPTYWLQVPAGTFTGTPLMHIHAIVFTGWLLLLVGQNWRIAQGRLEHHKAWGLFGIALATLILAVGYMTAITALEERLAAGYGDKARAFLIVPFTSVTTFYAFVIAAMANIRRPEWHKRFIFVGTAIALQAAVARAFFIYNTGWEAGTRPALFPPNPVWVSLMPFAVVCAIPLAGIAFDLRTRGKPHPAWTIGLAVLVVTQLLRLPVSGTDTWLAFADWTTRITG